MKSKGAICCTLEVAVLRELAEDHSTKQVAKNLLLSPEPARRIWVPSQR